MSNVKRITAAIVVGLLLCAAMPGGTLAARDGGSSFLSGCIQTLYDLDSSIPVSHVSAALQTSDGYMWFGGLQGLMRYNGITTRVFTPEDGFPTYNVTTLFEDSAGKLWVGTSDSGIVSCAGGLFTVFGPEHGLPAATVRSIAEDERGNIYVATASGVVFISPDGRVLPLAGLSNVLAVQIAHLGQNRFVCLTGDGTVLTFGDSGITGRLDDVPSLRPTSLYAARSGALYIGTAEGAVMVTDAALSRPEIMSLPRQAVNSFFEDSTGRLWLCCDDGLGYLENGIFTAVDGLNMSSSIGQIVEDYEGNFWVASSSQGLLQLTRGRFKNISLEYGLPDYTVNAAAAFNGALYIGTDSGLVVLRDGENTQTALTKSLGDTRVRDLLVDSSGTLWICTNDRGVFALAQNGQTSIFSAAGGLVSDRALCAAEIAGGVAIGTDSGISIIEGFEITRSFTRQNGLTNDMIISLCQTPDGTIYAGSDGGGLFAISNGDIVNYTERDGLSSGVILRVAAIAGKLWISTGNAICVKDEAGIRPLQKLTTFDDSVFDMIEVNGDVWLLHSSGINICDISCVFSDEKLKITKLRRVDGLTAPITAGSRSSVAGGELYISTGKGVFSIGLEPPEIQSAVPVADIYSIRADGVYLTPEGAIELGRNVRYVDIYPALLSYASKSGTLTYILEGFDSEEKTIERGENSWVSYTNLPGGDYVFRLYGTNADGVKSEVVSIDVYKRHKPLEMPLVRTLIVVVCIGVLAYALWRYVAGRTETLRRQRLEYKEVTGQALSVIASMIDAKNEYTAGHSRRVAQYAVMLGSGLGLSEDELEALRYSALLHDIGKISVPDSVLAKSTPLTRDEREIMRSHTSIGGEILSEITGMGDISIGAHYHHERMDGSGYPEGLSGEQIPLAARIIHVANAYDAMNSDQPHRKALNAKEIKSELINNAGTQLDAKITALLIELMDRGEIPI